MNDKQKLKNNLKDIDRFFSLTQQTKRLSLILMPFNIFITRLCLTHIQTTQFSELNQEMKSFQTLQ